MTLLEAIAARHSVRAYQDKPLEADVVRILEEQIERVNREGNLHVQLIQNEPKAFQGTLAKYGRFRNVSNYLVMAGKKADDLEERIGYYGEQLVLLAQTLGLNTCWVGLSYSKIPGTYVLNEEKSYIDMTFTGAFYEEDGEREDHAGQAAHKDGRWIYRFNGDTIYITAENGHTSKYWKK